MSRNRKIDRISLRFEKAPSKAFPQKPAGKRRSPPAAAGFQAPAFLAAALFELETNLS